MATNIPYELEYLGFTPNEVKVYLTLLRIGRAQAGQLAKEARLERTSTYNALKRLIQEGLVASVIEANKQVFSPASPNKIIDIFKEKEERASLLIPQLEEMQKGEREKENIKKFQGYQGIKTVLNDILRSCKKGEEYLVIGSEGQLSQRLPTFAEIFVARKDKKRLKSRLLVRENVQGRKMSKYTQVRYLPPEIVSQTNINIYANKVALILWSEKPEAIIIDDKATARTFKAYFEFMWQNAKKEHN